MLLPKLGGFWLLPPQDFLNKRERHPMDHDSVFDPFDSFKNKF
jgi:hypothetical protein